MIEAVLLETGDVILTTTCDDEIVDVFVVPYRCHCEYPLRRDDGSCGKCGSLDL